MLTKSQIMQIGIGSKSPALMARLMRDHRNRQPRRRRKPPTGMRVFGGNIFDPEYIENGNGWIVKWSRNGELHRTCYWNAKGWLHRPDGPAIIWENGDEAWYVGGKLHRDDGPAVDVINPNSVVISVPPGRGTNFKYISLWTNQPGKIFRYMPVAQRWYQYGLPHNLDGPAIVKRDGVKVWMVDGQEHRVGGPAYIGHGLERWMIKGKRHRLDGPAIIYEAKAEGEGEPEDGNGEEYWVEGNRHREYGPAIIRKGYQAWYLYSKIHREDGPAIEFTDSEKPDEYWVQGQQMDEAEYKIWQSRKYKGCGCGQEECKDCEEFGGKDHCRANCGSGCNCGSKTKP